MGVDEVGSCADAAGVVTFGLGSGSRLADEAISPEAVMAVETAAKAGGFEV